MNPGGVGDRCGLKAEDAVLSINNKPSDELEHEAAKYEILRAGNQVEMLIQRSVGPALLSNARMQGNKAARVLATCLSNG